MMTEKDTDEQTRALALWNAPDPEDGSPEQGDIVPGDGARVPRGGSSLAVGLAACALGSVVAAYIPMLGCFAIGSGAVITLVPRNALRALATLACALVPAALVAAVVQAATVPSVLVACGMAVGTAWASSRSRLSPSVGFALIGCGALALIGVDVIQLLSAGSSMADKITQLVNAYASGVGVASVSVAAQVEALRVTLQVYWPSAYLVVALAEFACALLGVRASVRREGLRVSMPALAEYDVPVWLIGVLVADILGLTAAGLVPQAYAGAVDMASANLLVALRIACAVQGFAVIAWFIRTRHVGALAGACAIVAGLFLEDQFYVMTIVGLVDVWKNFRHLPRGAKTTVQGTTDQDQKSA
ncbi:DUF2232 domain-containing protein [Tractidigestivibacter sp.]|uniref:DUF2232 domain-containing protein n=1 Tax=Tractidigestivibacter sp. TaxID=2847320 RepID=UPI002A916F64|nr:DUF2232 domain-containing protein [Tractidigestivibacter sp.]MDY5271397.1 DUF2232 domain-containing protein [Tractidigestivibacter sp.]